MADQTDPKTEDLGKQLAEQMQGKLDTDEARRLETESDEDYDKTVLTVLETKLKAATLGFNDMAKAADQLTVEKGRQHAAAVQGKPARVRGEGQPSAGADRSRDADDTGADVCRCGWSGRVHV